MGFLTLFFIALGLAMDAFAVSVSNGICYRNIGFKEVAATALTFGFFQAAMPLIGFYAGRTVSSAVLFFDHWIAFALLSFIGGNMIYQAFKEMRQPEKRECRTHCSLKDLTIQGIATSIDAFAIGISLAVINTNIFEAVAIIGIVTFICCMFGVLLGKQFGGMLQEKAEILGGIILICIGIKILIEHMSAGAI